MGPKEPGSQYQTQMSCYCSVTFLGLGLIGWDFVERPQVLLAAKVHSGRVSKVYQKLLGGITVTYSVGESRLSG